MFTRRHEQELAEIRALTQELDRSVTEVLEHVKGMAAAGAPRAVHEDIHDEVEALAARHGLGEGAVDALRGLVRLVDWGQANFVPRPEPGRPEGDRQGTRTPSRRTALNLLSESLAGLELGPVRAARRVGDVGSGAGFPGLVLAIALPRARVTLMERIPERCAFLRHAVAELGLENVEVVEGEVRPGTAGVGPFDVVTSRKVGRLNTMVEMAAPFLARGGAVALWPGTTDFADEERTAAAKAADAAGMRLAHVLTLPSENRKGQQVVKHLHLFEKAREASRTQTAGGDPILAFVHIPKTAGGTVTAMLAGVYSVDAIGKTGNYLSDAERTRAKVMGRTAAGWESWRRHGGRVAVGHTPYGVFRLGMPPETRYMTFLREPIDRVLSHYDRHIRRRNPARAGTPKDLASVKPRAGSLEEALVEMRLPALSNLATRFLCTHPSPSGELPASALDEAKANLREFTFVGIQERFEESIALLGRTLGIDLAPHAGRDRHVSNDRPTVAELPEEQRALIEEHNQLDTQLYEFALELFEDALSKADQPKRRGS